MKYSFYPISLVNAAVQKNHEFICFCESVFNFFRHAELDSASRWAVERIRRVIVYGVIFALPSTWIAGQARNDGSFVTVAYSHDC